MATISRAVPLIERKAALDEILGGSAGVAGASLQRAFRDEWRDAAAACLRARRRRHRLEAARRALSLGPQPRLEQVEMRQSAGIRHRRLRALDDDAQSDRLARARLL